MTCFKCGTENGPGPKELRPYGPNGVDVCFGCAFVCFGCAFGSPEQKKTTEAEFRRRLDEIDGPVILTSDGPKSAKR